jgi:hypothetical protein
LICKRKLYDLGGRFDNKSISGVHHKEYRIASIYVWAGC